MLQTLKSHLLRLFYPKKSQKAQPVPKNEQGLFTLKLKELTVGYLQYKEGLWRFWYAEEFIEQDTYDYIIGFLDPNKDYKSERLWPFFKIRIPGLGQPAVQEVLEEENIDPKNEAALLKRFGYESISNPFTLQWEEG